jgi:DNA end-binding protein Ku
MARPLWKGQLSFGLVALPVELYSAEARSDLHFTLLDSRDHSRIRYERVNEDTGDEVPWNQIVKGYEYDKGNYVVLTEGDFKKAAVEATRTIEIEDFVDLDQVSPTYFDKPYFLVPGNGGEKGYVLLREGLRKTNRAGIAKVVIRTRQYLAAVMPADEALLLVLLRFNQELREFSDVAGGAAAKMKSKKAAPKELALAERLIETMSAEWKPEKYHDEYRDALMKWIERKAKGGAKALPAGKEEEIEEAPATYNFMELLRKSVEGAGAGAAKGRGRGAAAAKPKTAKRRRAG